MRLTSAVRSAVVASLLLATPVLAAAEPTLAPAPSAEQGRHGGRHHHKRFKHEDKLLRMEQRLDRAVANGRLDKAQADAFKAEGRKLHEELKAQREAAGGQLTDDQRAQMKERMKAFRAKVKSAIKPKDTQL
jgi:protein CpxP